MTFAKVKEKISEKLTLWHLGNSFKGKVHYRFGQYAKDVFIFKDCADKTAHAMLWDTIIMPERVFQHSKNVKDLFFLHEYGHTKLNAALKLLFYCTAIPLLLLLLISIAVTIIYPLSLLIMGTKAIKVVFVLISALLLTAIIGLLIMPVSWASELHAELFAINAMGKRRYLQAIRELKKEEIKQNLFSRIFHRMRYPTLKIIMYFYEKFYT